MVKINIFLKKKKGTKARNYDYLNNFLSSLEGVTFSAVSTGIIFGEGNCMVLGNINPSRIYETIISKGYNIKNSKITI